MVGCLNGVLPIQNTEQANTKDMHVTVSLPTLGSTQRAPACTGQRGIASLYSFAF